MQLEIIIGHRLTSLKLNQKAGVENQIFDEDII